MTDILTYEGYSVVPEYAVQVAYMVSCAEAAYNQGRMNSFEIGDIFTDFISGFIDLEEAIEVFNDQL